MIMRLLEHGKRPLRLPSTLVQPRSDLGLVDAAPGSAEEASPVEERQVMRCAVGREAVAVQKDAPDGGAGGHIGGVLE